MSHQQDRGTGLVDFLKDIHDFLRSRGIKCSGRFISKQDRRVVNHSPANCRSLELSAGDLADIMICHGHNSHPLHQFLRFFYDLLSALFTRLECRENNIILNG